MIHEGDTIDETYYLYSSYVSDVSSYSLYQGKTSSTLQKSCYGIPLCKLKNLLCLSLLD